MKKINWGWRIVILYLAFVVFILSLVFRTMMEKTELVSADYYARELVFQKQLDKQNRTKNLQEQMNWNISGKRVTLHFPKQFHGKAIKAQILFYRPGDSSKDFSVSVAPDSSGNCTLKPEQLQAGVYRMKIDWSASGAEYYNESTIKINQWN